LLKYRVLPDRKTRQKDNKKSSTPARAAFFIAGRGLPAATGI
jgi:hypothetical protein